MPDFATIIKNHASLGHFAGTENTSENEDAKRTSLISALDIRKVECIFRYRIAVAILLTAVIILVYLSVFRPNGVQTFKDFMGLLGGGSIIALLYYIISVRDELTKIKQTTIIASAVDGATLNTLLLTLSSR